MLTSTHQELSNSEMTGYVAAQTSPECKKRKLEATNIESLTDDIIFDILVRVPAQDIYDSARLVCRKWYKMTQTRDFIHSHLQRSTPGLLNVYKQTFMTMQNYRIEVSKFSYGFEGKVLSSCNGLLLELLENLPELYIMNPVTKQRFALPPFRKVVMSYNRFAIAYVASSGAYKVVRAHSNRNNLGCSIMTVGVDTGWGRHVRTQHLSKPAKELLTRSPLTTQGFVHWVRNGWAHKCKCNTDCVVTMNVESEIITQIPNPCLCLDGENLRYCYFPMGSYLSLLIARSKYSWEAWKMKPETGEWTKMPNIDMKPMFKHLFFKLKSSDFERWPIPVGWLNSQEELFFGIPNFSFPVFASYNVRTRKICSLYELDSMETKIYSLYQVMETLFVDHKNSVVRLD